MKGSRSPVGQDKELVEERRRVFEDRECRKSCHRKLPLVYESVAFLSICCLKDVVGCASGSAHEKARTDASQRNVRNVGFSARPNATNVQ